MRRVNAVRLQPEKGAKPTRLLLEAPCRDKVENHLGAACEKGPVTTL